jgi:hypothetical protein
LAHQLLLLLLVEVMGLALQYILLTLAALVVAVLVKQLTLQVEQAVLVIHQQLHQAKAITAVTL